jgi:uncharacterized membrane protein
MWVIYALLGAIAKALTSYIRKKISKTNNAIYVFLSFNIIVVIITLLVLLIPGESITSIKYAPLALIISGLIQIVAIRANLYAFKYEELSYITPMFALTPLYAAGIGYLLLGEVPSWLGMLGILAIVFGVYTVTNKNGVGLAKTAKHLLKNKGARAGMLVPISYAASAVFNKDALNKGVTPLASLIIIMLVMGMAHIYVLFKNTQEVKSTLKDSKLRNLILLASLTGVASVGFASLALNDAFASYTLSIRRLDVLITVFLGWKFMGDSDFVRRIIGTVIMTIGVVLVSIG